MKILGINGSPRKEMSTFQALQACMDAIREAHPEIQTKIIELGELQINGCSACGDCKKELKCSIEDDFQPIIPKLSDKDVVGLIIGTPVYMGSMTTRCKAFLERMAMFRRNGFLYRNKVGGVLAVGGFRNGGQELTIQTVQAGLMVQDMIIVSDGMDTSHFGGTLWNAGDKGLDEDHYGIKTAKNLGTRVSSLALKLWS